MTCSTKCFASMAFAAFLLIGCNAERGGLSSIAEQVQPFPINETSDASAVGPNLPAQTGSDTARAAYLKLMRPDGDRLILPREGDERGLPMVSSKPDIEIVRKLAGTLGTSINDEIDFRFDQHGGRLTVQNLTRPSPVETSHPNASPDDLLREAVAILEALGGEHAEMRPEAGLITAFGGRRGEAAVARPVFNKVRIARFVLGVSVEGDYLFGTHLLDGTFVRLIARWRPVDFQASSLTTQLSRNDVFERAADYLLSRGVKLPQTTWAIEVGTFYRANITASGYYELELRGYAAVRNARNGVVGSEGKVPIYDFALATLEEPAAIEEDDLAESSDVSGSLSPEAIGTDTDDTTTTN